MARPKKKIDPDDETLSDTEAAKLSSMSVSDRFLAGMEAGMTARFGKGKTQNISNEVLDFIEMPDLSQQYALGRPGYSTKRILYILGEEGASKSTRALHVAGKVQKAGGLAALLDWEKAPHQKMYQSYLPDPEAFLKMTYQPDSLQHGFQIMEVIFKRFREIDPENKIQKVIIGDSVGGATLQELLDEEMELDSQVPGIKGKYLGTTIPWLQQKIVQTNTLMIFVGQARPIIDFKGGYGKGNLPYYETITGTGGKAIPFHATYYEVLQKRGVIKGTGDEKDGFEAEVVYKKNKLDCPFKKLRYDVIWGEDLSYVRHTMDFLAIGEFLGLKEQKIGNRIHYICPEIGMGPLRAAEAYEVVHSEKVKHLFQASLGINTSNLLLPEDIAKSQETEAAAIEAQAKAAEGATG